MNFEPTEEQKLVRETARDFAEKRLKPAAAKFDEEEAIPRELYDEAAALGFLGMQVPEAYGGLSLDSVSYALAMEELARGSAAFQVGLSVHNSLVCEALLQFGTEAQKKAYLPRLAKGELIGAYSLTEPGSGSDAGALVCKAVRADGAYVLNGTKSWVTNAGHAGLFVVFVSTSPEKKSGGVSCLLVEKLPGFALGEKEKKMGIRASDTRELMFKDCRVEGSALLGAEDEGFKIALALLDVGRVGIAAQAVGIAQAAYEEAVAYAKMREQFGKSLARLQATQFKLADMAVRIDAARLLVHRAAWLKDQGGRPTRQVSMAKLAASEAANRVAFQSLQIHGAVGYSRESVIERLFRDARVTEIYEGTSEIQRIVIARDILRHGA